MHMFNEEKPQNKEGNFSGIEFCHNSCNHQGFPDLEGHTKEKGLSEFAS